MNGAGPDGEFIGKWVGIAQRARERALAELHEKSPDMQARACEQAAILVSLNNLMTYPWIAQRVKAGEVHLHGWYFDMVNGALLHYNPVCECFEPIESALPG